MGWFYCGKYAWISFSRNNIRGLVMEDVVYSRRFFALIEDNRFDRFLSIDKGIQFRLSELPHKYMASSELCELQEAYNIPLYVVTDKLLEELFM